MPKQIIGTIVSDGKERPAILDVQAMLATHMAIVASSGGGKSWLLRKLLENTFGLMPHLVIDVEGELKTLREKFDYLIASADGEGDILAHPRSAKLLAHRLLELNVSCIMDIYELEPDEKVLFVKDFISALVNAPKELWGQRLVVIDEAHQFVPQNNERGMASRAAVISLLDKGRKRGLSTVLATQRLSKVSKDALGECRNKLYGFCNLPADRKRATEDLGFLSKGDQELFRQLDTGHFYAVGPAISKKDVVMVRVGKVQTTHPRPGDGIAAVTPPAPAKIKKLISELKDLPAQAKKEAEDLKTAQARIKELEHQVKAPQVVEKVVERGASKAEVKVAYEQGRADSHIAVKELVAHLSRDVDSLTRLNQELLGQCQKVLQTHGAKAHEIVRSIASVLARQLKSPKQKVFTPMGTMTGRTSSSTPNISNPPRAMPSDAVANLGDLSSAEFRILDSLAWWEAVGVSQPTRLQAAFAARYTINGHFNNTLGSLNTRGYIQYPSRGTIELTGEGRGCATHPDVPPTAEALQIMVRGKLDGPTTKLYDVLISKYPDAVSRDELASTAGYTVNGHFNNTLGTLHSMGVAEYPDRGLVRASKVLFLEA
jgi:hypothetical protein